MVVMASVWCYISNKQEYKIGAHIDLHAAFTVMVLCSLSSIHASQ